MVGRIHFNKYRVIKQIGNGGMSHVFLAENIKLGNKWAIKRIKKNSSAINLLAEPSILKDLNHPLIPQIVDIEEDETYLYIIEEYVEGINLQDYKNQNKNISEDMIIDLAIQMCDVLEYLHSRKPYPIIYRDMKPGNIMLTESNQIKLVDFGIAKEYKSSSDTDTVLIGTRGYAAPEQYGSGQSDVRTDVYSFGVTLYYLITGNNLSSPPYKILPIREYGNYSDSLENIIERCTRMEPSNRYQSVADIKEELNQMRNQRGLKTPTIYTVAKQKTIGVLSLTKSAGATFFATNLATALAERNVLTALIELPYGTPYIYDLVGISNYADIEYYSILNEIDGGNHAQRDTITTIDNIMYMVNDPTKEKIKNWDEHKTIKLLYTAKESSVAIVDIGYNYAKIENLLGEFDLIYAIYDAMPPDLMANHATFEKIYRLSKTNNNIKFVLNNDNDGINKKSLHHYLGIKPYITIPRLPAELIYKAAYKKKVPYKDSKLKHRFDEIFESIYKELLPKELNKKSYRKRKKFKL